MRQVDIYCLGVFPSWKHFLVVVQEFSSFNRTLPHSLHALAVFVNRFPIHFIQVSDHRAVHVLLWLVVWFEHHWIHQVILRMPHCLLVCVMHAVAVSHVLLILLLLLLVFECKILVGCESTLLRSTPIFPLQQVLQGRVVVHDQIWEVHDRWIILAVILTALKHPW